jgi:glycine dehydrogenase subunit 2
LRDFLPGKRIERVAGRAKLRSRAHSVGDVKAFHGNFLVCLKALAYIVNLGADGLKEASENAVLNANYLLRLLAPEFPAPFGTRCMHEFVLSVEALKKETGVSAADISKALIDAGMHPPTMYFPLTVHEALMFEPTETESKETLEHAAAVLKSVREKAFSEPDTLHNAPLRAQIRRADELTAARNPVLKV